MARANTAVGRIAYVNARLLDPATGLDTLGGILTDGELIADVGAGLFNSGAPVGATVVDCDGACLAPGLVDMRVHLREPGAEHKETIVTASSAAAAGGVTSMVCLPNTDPPIDNVAVLEFVARRAREAKLVKIFSYGAITQGLKGEELAEIGLLHEAGALAFTDGRRAVANASVMRRALSYARTFGALIVNHPEEPMLAADGVMNEGEASTRLGLPGITPMAEIIMIERDLRLVALTNGRYHAAHISTAAAVQAIRQAKQRGLNVTCDTAPHYFALNEFAVGDYRTFAKVSPPLRSEDDRQAIVDGLADGTIDAIASDHAPQDQDSKRLPFAQAAFGIIGLETLLPLALEIYHNGRWTLLDMIRTLSLRPSQILGLPSGKLAKGAAADFVLFDPNKPRQIDASTFRSKSKNSPYDARPVQGIVLRTVVDGRTVYAASRNSTRNSGA